MTTKLTQFSDWKKALFFVLGFILSAILFYWRKYDHYCLCAHPVFIRSISDAFHKTGYLRNSSNKNRKKLNLVPSTSSDSDKKWWSMFNSRYVYEHSERHGFPSEWIGCTFSVTTFWNGILAILAGELFSNKQVVPKNSDLKIYYKSNKIGKNIKQDRTFFKVKLYSEE